MASLVLPYPDFVNGTPANGDQVDANYAAIVTFLLTLVPHCDGTNAFTGLPVLPATAPGATNAARRDYVDTQVLSRVKSILPTSQVSVASGTASGTADASGNLTVSFGATFANAPYQVQLTASGTGLTNLQVTAITTTQFTVRSSNNGALSFYWLALGI